MKKTLFLTIILLVFASSASALYINSGEDVGGVDTLIASTDLENSGYATELEWVTAALLNKRLIDAKTDITLEEKYPDKDSIYSMNWFATYATKDDITNDNQVDYTYAIDLVTDPVFFFIKIGTGKFLDGTSHFLFQNLASLDYGVVNLANIDEIWCIKRNDDVFSHVGEIGTAPVPEPGTMLLLGAGLLGLAGFRRKMKN